MFRTRFAGLLLALVCLLGCACPVLAAEVDCDSTYCFTAQDFSVSEEPLRGICITDLPDSHTGAVMLGTRVLHSGDILTREQLEQMTFVPAKTLEDTQARVCYLPIYENRVQAGEVLSISVFGKEDKAPVAQDSALETYKNLPNDGKLTASDPEGEALTYTLMRQSKRGTVELRPDGTFTYTPKKNKVGVDSFTYTASDPAGNVSREATVTVQILKPTQTGKYADTVGEDCRFEAEWLRNTGLFQGEKVNDQICFFPEKDVSRGQFLAMAVQLLDIPTDADTVQVPEDTPVWMKPYLAAAMRAGLMEGLPEADSFNLETAITGAEAAVMLQNALDLTVSQETLEKEPSQQVPVWAASSLTVLEENGLQLHSEETMTRADTAKVLYRVHSLAVNAPGMAVFQMDK